MCILVELLYLRTRAAFPLIAQGFHPGLVWSPPEEGVGA
jgi:hypothetical protein